MANDNEALLEALRQQTNAMQALTERVGEMVELNQCLLEVLTDERELAGDDDVPRYLDGTPID